MKKKLKITKAEAKGKGIIYFNFGKNKGDKYFDDFIEFNK